MDVREFFFEKHGIIKNTNETQIILNDKFKTAIKKIEKKLDMTKFYHCASDFNKIWEQNKFRKLLKEMRKNKEFETSETHGLTKSDYFAGMCALMYYKTKEDKFEKVNKWSDIIIRDNIEEDSEYIWEDRENRDISGNRQRCCCGQFIKYKYRLNFGIYTLVIGEDCVCKMTIGKYKTTIKKHFKTMKENRKCVICNKYKINRTEPYWKKACLKCYIDSKRK